MIFILLCQHVSDVKSLSTSLSEKDHEANSNLRQANFNSLYCNGTRKRRDIRTFNTTELQDWQDAIIELIVERESKPLGFWDNLVQIHAKYSGEAHGGSYFLPWHRLFLLLLENEVRSRNRPNFALPYWDWTVDADNGAFSEIWNASFVGGATVSAYPGFGNPILGGPFENLTAQMTKPHLVLRNFSSAAIGGMRRLPKSSLVSKIINASTFDSFTVNTEVSHGIVHNAIGGDMAQTKISPNDPVFYLLHAFVDYMYSMRQKLAGISDFGGTHDFPKRSRQANPEYIMKAFQRPVKDAFDLQCVTYVSYTPTALVLSQRQPVQSSDAHSSPSPDVSILQEACHDSRSRMHISEKRCLKAMHDL